MNTNLLICKNETFIEGVNIGKFEAFESDLQSRQLGGTAVLTLPLYAIGDGANAESRARSSIRKVFIQKKNGKVFNLIRPCARVEVFCWYESWIDGSMQIVGGEKIKVFSGFISHVAEGFPTKLYLQDNSFILRFGSIQKAWDENATLQKIIADIVPIAQKGFEEERNRLGLTNPLPALTYQTGKQNVQAVTTSVSFRNWGARSPYDTIQKLMQLLVLYGGVSDDFNVYVGTGTTENNRPQITLDTRTNVLERNIVPLDGRFIDYEVKVVGILSNGRQYTATGGYGTSRSTGSKDQLERQYAETVRGHSVLNTIDGIQETADQLLASLKGFRNKGTITTLLLPKLTIMDWVKYNDTIFPELSSGYYVIGYKFKADTRGYFQRLEVTDQIFAL